MLYLTIAIVLVVLVGGVLARLALGASWPRKQSTSAAEEPKRSRFFIFGGKGASQKTTDALLLSRLEQHVRAERAAVEHSADQPKAEALKGNDRSTPS